MNIRFDQKNQVLQIILSGELDHHSSVSAREQIDLRITTACCQKVVYLLDELSFMDSSGIGLIANGCKVAHAIGAKVFVYTQNEKFLKMFQLARLQELCPILSLEKELNTLWKS